MKTTFSKLALAAGVTAGLAGVSIPAHAIFVGDPGEAALVPYAVSIDPNISGAAFGYQNTVVKITVPKSVGNDVISNFYTAPNSSPTNGNASAPGSENPGDANLLPPSNAVGTGALLGQALPPSSAGCSGSGATGTSCIHWYWMNERSVHEANGSFPVSQDDVAVFDWQAVSDGGFNGRLGYLVFVTEAANTGAAANFSFFADAWWVIGATAATNTKVSIPALPMADGADTTDRPTMTNNVIEYNTQGELIVRASPLVSGMRTIWADGKSNSYVFDLPLANNYRFAGANAATMAVVWNDRNAGDLMLVDGKFENGPWWSMPAFRFNNNEMKCSGRISLPEQLTVTYIPWRLAAASANPTLPSAMAQFPNFFNGVVPTPAQEPGNETTPPGSFALLQQSNDPYADVSSASADAASWFAVNSICTVPANDGPNNGPLPATNAPATVFNDIGMSGGFVKIVAPEPENLNTQTVEGAAVMFTLPIHIDGGWAGWPLFLGDTLLGHPAGAFTTAPN